MSGPLLANCRDANGNDFTTLYIKGAQLKLWGVVKLTLGAGGSRIAAHARGRAGGCKLEAEDVGSFGINPLVSREGAGVIRAVDVCARGDRANRRR